MKLSTQWHFLIICFLNYVLLLLGDLLFNKKELIYQSFIGQLEESKVTEILDYYSTMQLWFYLVIPLVVFLKVFLVFLILQVGIHLKGYKISSKDTIEIVTKAQYAVVGGALVSILYIWILGNYKTIEDLSVVPFSALSLFKPSEVESWLKYPLSLFSIFEVFYWVVLVVQWKKISGKSYSESFDFIASTYGLSLFLWVLVVLFFTI